MTHVESELQAFKRPVSHLLKPAIEGEHSQLLEAHGLGGQAYLGDLGTCHQEDGAVDDDQRTQEVSLLIDTRGHLATGVEGRK